MATVLGYGVAGLTLAITEGGDPETLGPFALMVASSAMLGGVFIAIGCMISALVRDRGAAGGIAIGVWLVFVLLYDMALLGVLVADQGRRITAGFVSALLLLNPADIYRVLNLTTSESVGRYAGVAGLGMRVGLAPGLLTCALLVWIAVPLGGAIAAFSRRQV
jgi:Cu-processing system permease protein